MSRQIFTTLYTHEISGETLSLHSGYLHSLAESSLDRQSATTFFRPSLYLNVTLYDCRDNNHLINFALCARFCDIREWVVIYIVVGCPKIQFLNFCRAATWALHRFYLAHILYWLPKTHFIGVPHSIPLRYTAQPE